MKSKTFGKKLFLNKKTIANLSNNELGNAVGGKLGIPPPFTETNCVICPTDYTDCGTCITCGDTNCPT